MNRETGAWNKEDRGEGRSRRYEEKKGNRSVRPWPVRMFQNVVEASKGRTNTRARSKDLRTAQTIASRGGPRTSEARTDALSRARSMSRCVCCCSRVSLTIPICACVFVCVYFHSIEYELAQNGPSMEPWCFGNFFSMPVLYRESVDSPTP